MRSPCRLLVGFGWGLLAMQAPAWPQAPAVASHDPLFPETGLDRCLHSLPAGFLDDASGSWSVGLSSASLLPVAGLYARLRDCLDLSGEAPDSLPIPPALAEKIPPGRQFGGLFRFYRRCGREGETAAFPECKRLVKVHVAGYLDEGADWDELCREWCRAFASGDAGACAGAVERFTHRDYVNRASLAGLCREFTALDRRACEHAPPERQQACVDRAYVAEALRTRDPARCPEPARWDCEAALGDRKDCLRRFSLGIGLLRCLSRSSPP